MVIDTEQRDMDAPWEPEGTEKLVVGALVRFRMGERIPAICPSCGHANLTEKTFEEHSGGTFRINVINHARFTRCTACEERHDFGIAAYPYGIDASGVHPVVGKYHGIYAAAIELTLVEEPDEQ